MTSALHGILGNTSAERVLLHLYHYGEIHASAIAADYENGRDTGQTTTGAA